MTTKIRLNLGGFRKFRRSDAARDLIMEIAEDIAQAAGEGYEAQAAPGRNRARATVFPVTDEAIRDNAKNLTLIKSLRAGRR